MNFTGVINKARDAGYKIIIVLAGTLNSLRSQTQKRIDYGFVGHTVDNNDESEITLVYHYRPMGNPKPYLLQRLKRTPVQITPNRI